MRNGDAIEKLKGGQSHRNYDMGKRHNRQQKQRKKQTHQTKHTRKYTCMKEGIQDKRNNTGRIKTSSCDNTKLRVQSLGKPETHVRIN